MKRDRLDMEIESIENDDSLTNEEKYNEIRDIERDYERYTRDQAQEAYDNEYETY